MGRHVTPDVTHRLASPPPLPLSVMPDQRKHRGPHPEDARLFAAELWPTFRRRRPISAGS